jgi:hypothetical protein
MTFDYAASAELFVPKGKPGARRTTSYRRFRAAAEAIRFAVEEFPAIRTLGAWMRVGDEASTAMTFGACTRATPIHDAVACGSPIDRQREKRH